MKLTKFAAIWVNEVEEAGFFLPDNLENHTSDWKGKEKKKERGGRKEEKRRKQWLYSYWLLWTHRKIPKISSSMYKPPKLVTQKTLR